MLKRKQESTKKHHDTRVKHITPNLDLTTSCQEQFHDHTFTVYTKKVIPIYPDYIIVLHEGFNFVEAEEERRHTKSRKSPTILHFPIFGQMEGTGGPSKAEGELHLFSITIECWQYGRTPMI